MSGLRKINNVTVIVGSIRNTINTTVALLIPLNGNWYYKQDCLGQTKEEDM